MNVKELKQGIAGMKGLGRIGTRLRGMRDEVPVIFQVNDTDFAKLSEITDEFGSVYLLGQKCNLVVNAYPNKLSLGLCAIISERVDGTLDIEVDNGQRVCNAVVLYTR